MYFPGNVVRAWWDIIHGGILSMGGYYPWGMLSGGCCPGDVVRGMLSGGCCPGDVVRGMLSGG